MKKIILILISLLLCGCYNYVEPEDIAIVSLMSIDYKDNLYHINLEVKENIKDNPNASIIYSGEGSTLEDTLKKIGLSINKNLYFIDLDVLIISTNVANIKRDSLIDYFTRDNNIGINFKIAISDDAESIIKNIKDKDKIVGEYISSILDAKSNDVININFGDFLEVYLNEYYDLILPYITINSNSVSVSNAIIFANHKTNEIINEDYVAIYNLLSKKNVKAIFDLTKDNKTILYKIAFSNINIKYKGDKIIVNGKILGYFDEMNKVSLDSNKEIMDNLLLAKSVIENRICNYLDLSIKNNSDTLGLKKKYYNSTRKKINNLNNIKYEIDIVIEVERQGLIFNSMGDEYGKHNKK